MSAPKYFGLRASSRKFQTTGNEANAKNLEIYPHALSNESGNTSFFQDTLTSATGCIAGKYKPWIEQYLTGYSNTISVKTKNLASVAKDDKIPSLVKIDVEGHEIEVLDGGRNILSEKKPLLIIESFPPKQTTVLSLLHELGYRSMDADLHTSINPHTTNLFAWHPEGPLDESVIRKVL